VSHVEHPGLAYPTAHAAQVLPANPGEHVAQVPSSLQVKQLESMTEQALQAEPATPEMW
jgi:hypothetical protein